MRLSYADLAAGDLLTTLLDVSNEKAGHALHGRVELTRKIKIIKDVAIVRHHSDDWLARIKTAVNELDELSQVRHRYAHDIWAVNIDGEVVKEQYKVELEQARKGAEPEVQTIAKTRVLVSHMHALADKIDAVAETIRRLRDEYLAAHLPPRL
jgi:hypothetical protein